MFCKKAEAHVHFLEKEVQRVLAFPGIYEGWKTDDENSVLQKVFSFENEEDIQELKRTLENICENARHKFHEFHTDGRDVKIVLHTASLRGISYTGKILFSGSEWENLFDFSAWSIYVDIFGIRHTKISKTNFFCFLCGSAGIKYIMQ